MSIGQSIAFCYQNYVNFNGRAGRSQFWWFYLYYVVIAIVLFTIERTLLDGNPVLSALWFLANILPLLAVGARRLHDTAKSGWWQLLLLLSCIGFIILAIFWAQEGRPEANTYGSPAS